jgi:hypothetical protein
MPQCLFWKNISMPFTDASIMSNIIVAHTRLPKYRVSPQNAQDVRFKCRSVMEKDFIVNSRTPHEYWA